MIRGYVVECDSTICRGPRGILAGHCTMLLSEADTPELAKRMAEAAGWWEMWGNRWWCPDCFRAANEELGPPFVKGTKAT